MTSGDGERAARSGDLIDAWWAGAAERRLLVQHCTGCGSYQHYPRPLCLSCERYEQLELVQASGTGTVWSFTEVHRSPSPDVEAPYTVALVRLDEGPVLLTRLTYPDPRCEDRVRLTWLDRGPHDPPLPVFARETPTGERANQQD